MTVLTDDTKALLKMTFPVLGDFVIEMVTSEKMAHDLIKATKSRGGDAGRYFVGTLHEGTKDARVAARCLDSIRHITDAKELSYTDYHVAVHCELVITRYIYDNKIKFPDRHTDYVGLVNRDPWNARNYQPVIRSILERDEVAATDSIHSSIMEGVL